jgi:hypothetical protein
MGERHKSQQGIQKTCPNAKVLREKEYRSEAVMMLGEKGTGLGFSCSDPLLLLKREKKKKKKKNRGRESLRHTWQQQSLWRVLRQASFLLWCVCHLRVPVVKPGSPERKYLEVVESVRGAA